MHRGRAHDDQRHKRDMRRMMLEDVAPTLAQPVLTRRLYRQSAIPMSW